MRQNRSKSSSWRCGVGARRLWGCGMDCEAEHTSGIGQFILLSLDAILEVLGFTARLLDARLHSLGRDIVLALRIHGDGPRGCGGLGWERASGRGPGRKSWAERRENGPTTGESRNKKKSVASFLSCRRRDREGRRERGVGRRQWELR